MVTQSSVVLGVMGFMSSTAIPLAFIVSLLVFAATSVLWLFFNKAYKKVHYTSLAIFALAVYVFIIMNLLAGGLYISPPNYVYKTELPFPGFFLLVFQHACIFLGYTVLAWIVILERWYLKLNNRNLLRIVVWVTIVCSLIILWQFALPCEYTPIGCKVSTIPNIPTLP